MKRAPKHLVRNYLVALVAAMCMIQYGYDATLFSSVQIVPSWRNYFGNPSPPLVGAVTTAYNVAAVAFGFFISPIISDGFGRRWAIALGSLFVVIGAFVMTFSPTIGGFIAGRVLVGAGQGLNLPSGPIYIGELVYARIRGRLMSFWQMCYGIGSILAAYIALGGIDSPHLGIWQWRIVTLLQIVPPSTLCAFLFFCPETPRWYLQKGRVEEARKVLMTVRLPEEVEPELTEIREALEYEKEFTKGRYRQLFINKSYRKRLILGIVLNFGQQLTGIGSLTNYSGIIYKQVFSSSNTIILINAITSVFGIFYTLIATFFVDKWGRRPMFIWGAVGQGLMMMAVATLVTQAPLVNGRPTLGTGIGTAIILNLFHVFYSPSWGATTWIWTAEVFPMVVRANAVAISSQTQQVAGIVLGQAFPSFLAKCNFYTFYFFMGINILLGIMIYFFFPETKGVSLEHMDAIFGGVDHVRGGEEMGIGAYDKEKGVETADDEAFKGVEATHLQDRR